MGVLLLKHRYRRTMIANCIMSFPQVGPDFNRESPICIDSRWKSSKCCFNGSPHGRNNDEVWPEINRDSQRFLITSFRERRVRERVTALDIMNGFAVSNDA